MGLLARALSLLLDGLAPPSCAACDTPTRDVFCEACGMPAPPSHPAGQSIDGVPLVSLGSYAPPLSTAITRFKYEGRAELARPLAQLLTPVVARLELPVSTLLVPVPLHRRRLALRGYNQAALLAKELAQNLGFGCEPRLLVRTRETERQVGKSRALRLTNASGAFAVYKRGATRVVLVDDVITTGSTVRACAQALTEAGIELTAVLAVAEALPG